MRGLVLVNKTSKEEPNIFDVYANIHNTNIIRRLSVLEKRYERVKKYKWLSLFYYRQIERLKSQLL